MGWINPDRLRMCFTSTTALLIVFADVTPASAGTEDPKCPCWDKPAVLYAAVKAAPGRVAVCGPAPDKTVFNLGERDYMAMIRKDTTLTNSAATGYWFATIRYDNIYPIGVCSTPTYKHPIGSAKDAKECIGIITAACFRIQNE